MWKVRRARCLPCQALTFSLKSMHMNSVHFCRGKLFAATLPFVVAATLVHWAHAQSQSVATVPVGLVTFEIIPREAEAPKLTVLSLPLRDTLTEAFVGQAAGPITGVTSSGIQNSAAAWNPTQFANSAEPYFIRIMTGTAQGRTLLISPSGTHSDTAVQVDNQATDLTSIGIATGSDSDAYEIFPADTLKSIFTGTAMSGSTAQEADYIQLFNGVSWSSYFHNGVNWRDTLTAINRDNVVIRPDSPILYHRRGTEKLAITLIGTVPSTPVQIVTRNSGASPSANPFPAQTTIAGTRSSKLSRLGVEPVRRNRRQGTDL
ncbi:MAG: hypothetical protein M3463_09895 [Verrucomicrobiota bacterium]|nr:hypothetical protein [Verrucomicrobiota bacterium]